MQTFLPYTLTEVLAERTGITIERRRRRRSLSRLLAAPFGSHQVDLGAAAGVGADL